MTKKKVKKRKTKRKAKPKVSKIIVQQAPVFKTPRVDSVLIENFVSLQRVLTNLTIKLDGVANQMTKLLDIFEISAKALT
ncbi:MAG: hypothetical protein KKB31_03885, partial [Nanoarchaeota archaeon]|nr:hypothetical protein [Nanoarchaeota archaeon]